MVSRLRDLLQIRRDETVMVSLVSAMFTVTQATHAFGANMADTLFFRRFGVEFLPYMFIGLGLLSVVATLSYGAGLARFASSRFLPVVLVTGAGVMLAQRAAVAIDVPGLYGGIWLITNLVTLVTFTLMWNVAVAVCDTRQAKRLFSIFAAAGILGGVIGNFSTGPLAASIGTDNLLIVIAGLLMAAAVLTRRIADRYISRAGPPTTGSSVIDYIRSGYSYVMGSRYFRRLGIAAAASMVLFYAVVFPFSEAAAAEFPTEPELAAFLGSFSGIATVVAFLVSLLVAGRVYAKLGVVGSVFVLPVVYSLGLVLWTVSFDLTTAAVVRGMQWVVIMGLSSTAFNALFNVARPDRKPQALSFILGIAGQLGISAAGVFLLIGSSLGDRRVVFGVALVIALGYGGVVWALRSQYATQLEDALKAGILDPFDAAHQSVASLEAHADVLAVISSVLDQEAPAARRLAAEILGRMESPAALPLLARAMEDPEDDVRLAAVAALDRLGGDRATEVAAAAFGDSDPGVRAAAVAAVARHTPQPVARFLPLAHDPSPEVRGRAAVGLFAGGMAGEATSLIRDLLGAKDSAAQLAGLEAAAGSSVPAELVIPFMDSERQDLRVTAVAALATGQHPAAKRALVEACRHPDDATRDAAARALRTGDTHLSDVRELLETGTEPVRRAALRALKEVDDPAELERWAQTRVTAAVSLHHCAVALGSGGRAVEYLAALVEAREWDIEQTVLEALARADHRPALALVERGLESTDAETKAQALEALDTLAGRAFSKPLLAVLDTDGTTDTDGREAALRFLLADPDPMLRALALVAGSEAHIGGWEKHVVQAGDDPAELVRDTATRLHAGSSDSVTAVADTLDTLGTVERVLLLREVPIFADLPVDDLVAIAEIGTERVLADGDCIMRRGEEAHEMFLLVGGQFDVHLEGKEVSVQDPGEPVGELALITRAPRSADVSAKGETRVLVIHCDAFEAILADRPAVTRALLSVLAERLAGRT